MTNAELLELARHWQTRLELSKYNLSVKFDARLKDDGRVEWNEENPSITIRIRRGLDDQAVTETLLHELMHPLFQVDRHCKDHEGAFNVISRLLVKGAA